jgi:hypothetical protein
MTSMQSRDQAAAEALVISLDEYIRARYGLITRRTSDHARAGRVTAWGFKLGGPSLSCAPGCLAGFTTALTSRRVLRTQPSQGSAPETAVGFVRMMSPNCDRHSIWDGRSSDRRRRRSADGDRYGIRGDRAVGRQDQSSPQCAC